MHQNKKKKIPLPWANEVDDRLQVATSHYWNISRAWNGFCGQGSTIGSALSDLNEIMTIVGPERTVAKRAETIKNNIIVYGTKNRKSKAEPVNDPQPAKMIIL